MLRLRSAVLSLLPCACAEPAAEAPDDDDTIVHVELPSSERCDALDDWSDDRRRAETRLLAAIDDAREDGGRCPDGRRFTPQPIPRLEGALVCAARDLAVSLASSDNFGHTDADDRTLVDRLADAGWDTLLATELVAAGDIDPEIVLDEVWLGSTPHCNAVHASAWTHVGVAMVEREVPDPPDPDAAMSWGAYWVVVFSADPT